MLSEVLIRKRLRHNIDLLNLNSLFGSLRFFQPISILYFAQITGNYTAAMGVFSCALILQLIFEIPMGALSDKWGRKAVMISGSGAECLAVLCYAVAGFSQSGSGWVWLYAGAGFFGMAEACFSGTIHAILFETLSVYKKTDLISKIIGRNYSMSQIGLAVSGLIAAALLWMGFGYQAVVSFTLIPFAFGFLSSVLLIEPPIHSVRDQDFWKHTLHSIKIITKDRRIRLLALAEMIRDGTGNSSNSFIPQFVAQVWPSWAVPLYRFAQNGVGAISFWKAGDAIWKFGPYKTYLFSEMGMRCLSIIAYVSATIMSPFLLVLGQIGYAMGTTANDSLKQENFTPQQRATLASFMAFGSSMVGALISLLLGAVADILSPTWALGLICILGIPALQIYNLLYKIEKNLGSER